MKTFVFCLVALALFETIGTCDDNQFPNSCGSACPLTCENRSNPPQMCTLQCVNRCDCNGGYIFLDANLDKCVKQDQCP
ncbi:unnamed protein product [Larinioides sclopetarius]|uniref:TIL domain-containing protein n=1 Tax=Larinioides sclopetarius TaxID=280406 RepID=A0AAV2BUA1_9ARAC